MPINFLTAEWKNLVLINFEADPSILVKHLPRGTELDYFNGKAYMSIVAFHFNRNKLFGLLPSFPHYSFEEVNLRFYIKRDGKKAVAFIKELVPSKLIATIARLLYQEPYEATPTHSEILCNEKGIEYRYSFGRNLEYTIKAETENAFVPLETDSFEEFILEHYHGYTAQSDATTVEYQVRHPKWRFTKASRFEISSNILNFYGSDFAKNLAAQPVSVFVAEGSKVSVSAPRRFFHPLNDENPKGWVLYDGLCGFCAWWIPYWKGAINKAGYDVTPLQTKWVKQKFGLGQEELNKDIRLLLNDGTLINGADAYIYGMKQVWWSSPFGYLLGLPLLRQITWKIYKIFNRNRFLVSKICRLKPEI